MVLYGETLDFITSAMVATVAEVDSGSTLRDTCLSTEAQKSVTKPTISCYTVQRLLKHVLQRSCTEVSPKQEAFV